MTDPYCRFKIKALLFSDKSEALIVDLVIRVWCLLIKRNDTFDQGYAGHFDPTQAARV